MPVISPLDLHYTSRILNAVLREDIGSGDITTRATINPRKNVHAVITAKSSGVLAGITFCSQTFVLLNQNLGMFYPAEDGHRIKKGQTVLEIRGQARAILQAERTALNVLGRMSGIATVTAQFVEKVKGTNAKILDTRKTMPGLRLFDKYAVRVGGGFNHRFGLDDMFLIKENHIAADGGIAEAVRKCIDHRTRLNRTDMVAIVAEAVSLADAVEAVEAGADRVLLDNMTPEEVRNAVKKLRSTTELEVSGGITLSNVREYAETGVVYISVGTLTHSPPSLDFSLLIQ